MQPTGQSPHRSHSFLWIIVVLAVVALIIDLLDGFTPKALTSLGLLVGVGGVLLVRLTGKASFNWIAIAGLLLCIGSAAYRAAVHQGWI